MTDAHNTEESEDDAIDRIAGQVDARYSSWRLRVVEERRALAEKISALAKFVATPQPGVAPLQAKLLQRQLEVMRDYHDVLTLRLSE